MSDALHVGYISVTTCRLHVGYGHGGGEDELDERGDGEHDTAILEGAPKPLVHAFFYFFCHQNRSDHIASDQFRVEWCGAEVRLHQSRAE